MIVKVAMFYSFLSNNHLIRSDIARDFFIHCQINSSYCMHLFTTTDFFCLLYQIDTCVQHEFAHLLFHPQNFFAVRFTNGGFRCILVFAFFIPFLHIGGTLHVDLFLDRGSPQPYARARARHARRRATPGSTPFRVFWSACSTTLPRANTRGSPPLRPTHPIWKSRW